jgi:hypothetical protein
MTENDIKPLRLVEDGKMLWTTAAYDDEKRAAELAARDRAVETEFEPRYNLERGNELNEETAKRSPEFKKQMEERRAAAKVVQRSGA